MSDNGRIFLIFLFNLFLYFCFGELKNIVGGWNVSLHLDVLLLVFFGLYLSHNMAFIYSALLGFISDAAVPAPDGTYLIGYLAIWLFFVTCQRRIRLQNAGHVRFVAMAAQLLWILALTVSMGGGQLGDFAYWQRILVDLSLSLLIIGVAVWPICVFQKKWLFSLGWDLESQMAKR